MASILIPSDISRFFVDVIKPSKDEIDGLIGRLPGTFPYTPVSVIRKKGKISRIRHNRVAYKTKPGLI